MIGRLKILLPGGVLLVATTPLFCHHSVSAEYDINHQATYQGVVTRVEWGNPHVYFYVDVKDAKHRVTNWAFEGAGPNTLARLGWLRDTLRVGDRVTVIAYPARDGVNVASAQEVKLTRGGKTFDEPAQAKSNINHKQASGE